jgi:hypothetical protein
MARPALTVLIVGMLAAAAAPAQQLIVYPTRGQTYEQQQADQGACYTWAQQTTGVNPVALAQQGTSSPPPPAPGRPVVGGTLGGAAAGAIIGSFSGNAGKGAGIGALTGLIGGGLVAGHRQQTYNAKQQQQQTQTQQALSTFNRAYSA